jgi:hypothetical protein
MIVPVNNATEAFILKAQLTDAGLIVDRDYTWRYHPERDYYEDPYNYAGKIRALVEFNFVDSRLESFYSLKWL